MWNVLGQISNTAFKDTMIKINVSSAAKKNYVSNIICRNVNHFYKYMRITTKRFSNDLKIFKWVNIEIFNTYERDLSAYLVFHKCLCHFTN